MREIIDSTELKKRANGQWLEIISGIDSRFDKAVENCGEHVACPIGTGSKDGFRFDKNSPAKGHAFTNSGESLGNGFEVLMWANKWTFRQSLEAVNSYLGAPTPQTTPPKKISEARTTEPPRKNTIPIKIWEQSKIEPSNPVKKYLEKRGLDEMAAMPKSLRSHEQLEYSEGKGNARVVLGSYPGLIAEIKKGGDIVGIQRQYLTDDGNKANVKNPKMMLSIATSACSGGAVQLGTPKDVLAITEGVENGLAVQQATGIPTWAATTGALLSKMIIPEHVKTVHIFADLDENGAGKKYATQLANRLGKSNIEATVLMPPIEIKTDEKGADWLDVLNQEGKKPFLKSIENAKETSQKEGGGTEISTTLTPTATQVQQTEADRKTANLFLDLALVRDDLSKKYAYLSGDDEFINMRNNKSIKAIALSNLYAHKTAGKGGIHHLLLKSELCKKADTRIYWPGRRERFFKYNNATVMNTWNPTHEKIPKTATDEDVSLWLDHAEHIIQSPKELNHLLDWMAFTLQNQDIKINHAILLAGKQRIGKDTLFQPLIHGIGRHNTVEPEASELKEKYTDFLFDKKLVIFQEVMNYEKAGIENKLKPILASPPYEIRIRGFGSGFFEQPNIVHVIFMSNHRNALKVSSGERYFAVWSKAERLTDEYYKALYTWLNKEDGLGLVVRWLLNRDVSNFEPKSAAPQTDYVNEIQELGKTALEMEAEERIEGLLPPFESDIIRLIDCIDYFKTKGTNVKNLGTALSNLKHTGKTYKKSALPRKSLSLWIIRNKEKYKDADPRDIINYYERNHML